MKVTVDVIGLKELETAMMRIEKQATRGTVLRNALKAAAQPVAEAMRAKAPKDTEDLARSITVSAKLATNVGDAAYAAAMKAGLGKANAVLAKRAAFREAKASKPSAVLFVGPAKGMFYAHLVEFGSKPHINGGRFAGSKHPGTAAQPFIRPAWDATQGEALSIITKELRLQIGKALMKQIKARIKAGGGNG